MALLRLRQGRLIRRSGTESTRACLWRLTRRGASAVSMPSSRTEAPPAPDGLVYFVSYDIPVQLGAVRDQFRAALHRGGWCRLHKSLWIADRDVRDVAVDAAEQYGIGGHVFTGTGALVRPSRRSGMSDRTSDLASALRAMIEETAGDPSVVFRRWAELTESLRELAAASALDSTMRLSWVRAAKVVKRALIMA